MNYFRRFPAVPLPIYLYAVIAVLSISVLILGVGAGLGWFSKCGARGVTDWKSVQFRGIGRIVGPSNTEYAETSFLNRPDLPCDVREEVTELLSNPIECGEDGGALTVNYIDGTGRSNSICATRNKTTEIGKMVDQVDLVFIKKVEDMQAGRTTMS
jgi:hypothetical protein